MGNEGYRHDHDHHSHGQNYKVKLLVLVLLTNFLTFYIFNGPNFSSFKSHSRDSEYSNIKAQLAGSLSAIAQLHQRLNSTNMLVQALLIELTRQQDKQQQQPYSSNYINNNINPTSTSTSTLVNSLVNVGGSSSDDELHVAVGPHKLPFGFSPRIGSDEMEMAIGAACLRLQEELKEFMGYEVGGECLVDDVFAERLMLKGCDPLPRRRCHPKSPANYPDPKPLPESLWTIPPADTITIWDSYPCKTYQQCLNTINHHLQNDNSRWVNDDGGLNFGIDQVLSTRPRGTIRIGLDINGERATASFAAKMMEENVTIITTTLNSDAPFTTFIASRGLIPLHITMTQRLPFFENTLDIVHSSMNGIGNWMPQSVLEFALYDIYRVLRPGGLLWIDHFFCFRAHMNRTYSLILGQVGFKSLRWHGGDGRTGRGRKNNNEWYISALLEKPKL